MSGSLTIVISFTGVLNLQHPVPHGVLIPGVGCHESPVIEAISRIVMRPGRTEKRKQAQSGVALQGAEACNEVGGRPTWLPAGWNGCLGD